MALSLPPAFAAVVAEAAWGSLNKVLGLTDVGWIMWDWLMRDWLLWVRVAMMLAQWSRIQRPQTLMQGHQTLVQGVGKLS